MTMCAPYLILLAILAQASPSAGDPQAKAQAQALLGQGTKLYQQGDVAGALEQFNAAYAAYASPKLMFNIGQANRDLRRPVEALEAFEKFLAGAADAPPEMIADAHKSVSQLQEKLGRIQIDCETAGAEVSVDGKSVGLAPVPDPIWATPGRHQVTAKHASTAPALEDVDVTAGSVSTVTLQLRPLAASLVASAPKAVPNSDVQATAPSSEANEGWWLGRRWTWVAAGSTVLLAVGAISAGLLMDSRFDSLRSSCGAGNPARPGCTQSQLDTLNSRQTAANVLWGLTAAAAVTTGALFYFEGRPVTVTPVAGGATGVLARMEF
jgi:cell division septum initiation protein DivIVA